ncbi:trimethylamine methyltransferase family protein [candidate division KSB1 bacterium]
MKDKYKLNIPRLTILSKDKIETLHLSTLEVLRRTGVDVKEPDALKIFKKGGCYVDGERVRIPSNIVEWALRNTPPRVCMCDRNGNPAMFLEENNTYFGNGSDTPYIINPFTQERRRAKIMDVENVSKAVDYLSEISFVMSGGVASDVNQEISDIYHFEAMVNNTEKPIVFTSWSLKNLKAIIEMAEVVAGGAEKLKNAPFLTLYTEPISPLLLAEESTQKLMYMAEKSLPVVFTPGLIMGATGPITIAGGLVQGNAEILAGYVLANFVNEGTPFIYGGAVLPMDMATSLMSYTTPEFLLATSAFTDMARYYRLPMFSFGGCTDSNIFDQQASLEGTLWTMISALNGGNLVHDVGYINNGLTTSFEQLVVSDEVIGFMRHITRGFEINEDTLALDLIDEIGPGGEFLTSRHTLEHFKENWFADLISKTQYTKWEEEGKTDLSTRANERAKYILDNHVPKPLEEQLKNEINKIVKSRDK